MKNRTAWFTIMVALLALFNTTQPTVPLRVALAASALVVLFDVFCRIKDLFGGE